MGQPLLSIPPGVPAYDAQPNLCPAECTRARLPPGANVTIVAAAPHMHLIGRAFVTQHLRGTAELAPVLRRQYFDFNYQGTEPVDPSTAVLRPGDSLVTRCTYDSTPRSSETQ